MTKNGVFFTIGRLFGKLTGSSASGSQSGGVKPSKPNLFERNHDIIVRHFDRISVDGRSYYVENAVRDCIVEIAAHEGKQHLIPKYREWLSKWRTRPDIPEDFRQLANQLQESFQTRRTWLLSEKDREEKQRTELQGQKLVARNQDLIDKFLEIAERKVSILDDYGDENWAALSGEINVCMGKIANREGLGGEWDRYLSGKRTGQWLSLFLPKEYEWVQEQLESRFREFHDRLRANVPDHSGVDSLSGEEFETYVGRLLRSRGYEVVGTPKTGDQGADLIARKDGRTVVIQAKRYEGPVGNKAVQEAIGAVHFYGGDEGWVVTNSTFTPSAKALAQKSNIRLIDSKSLFLQKNL
jgi:hypothetical protein